MPKRSVREQRLRRGWTLEELAEHCASAGAPTAISNLYRIECGQVPRPALRLVLAGLLGLDVNDFERKAC